MSLELIIIGAEIMEHWILLHYSLLLVYMYFHNKTLNQ